jgi:UDP-N-acetylglucosamine 2-epimerase
MNVLSVVGARPQFIKASAVSRELRLHCQEKLVHTGQHYDHAMSGVFFEELGIPEPDYNLNIGSGAHGHQTGAMLAALEAVMLHEKPGWVLVYGDTNSTLAGALAAAKLHIPVVHVEAGLRSYNRTMPEEINRVLTDHCSEILFCPTQTAVENLTKEGITHHVFFVGDVMLDTLLTFLPRLDHIEVLTRIGVTAKEYVLATVHRASNTDDADALSRVLDCLAAVDATVIFPIHPRTAAAMTRFGLSFPINVKTIEPVNYQQMLVLERNARAVLTDSGGVQKEAYFLSTPCLTLRTETEWTETLATGWNQLVGLDPMKIKACLSLPHPSNDPPPLYGNGTAAKQIVEILTNIQGFA